MKGDEISLEDMFPNLLKDEGGSSPLRIAAVIQSKDAERRRLWSEIVEIAREHIPDYHFLNYEVSTFWTPGRGDRRRGGLHLHG